MLALMWYIKSVNGKWVDCIWKYICWLLLWEQVLGCVFVFSEVAFLFQRISKYKPEIVSPPWDGKTISVAWEMTCHWFLPLTSVFYTVCISRLCILGLTMFWDEFCFAFEWRMQLNLLENTDSNQLSHLRSCHINKSHVRKWRCPADFSLV